MDNNRVVMRAATQRRSIQHVRARSESADFPAIDALRRDARIMMAP